MWSCQEFCSAQHLMLKGFMLIDSPDTGAVRYQAGSYSLESS